jgi:hypothetical protein
MNYDPNYEVRTLLEPFLEGPLVHTFLRDTFFGAREYPPTSLVEFDFRRGRRKMAPFVAPLVGGKVMERMGYETRFFRAPRIAPVRALRTPDLEPRLPGESVYSGRTAADRAAELLAEDAIFCDESISRREEWMCRQVLVNGGITVTAENNYTMLINYLEYGIPSANANNHFIPAPQWDNTTTSDPLLDLEQARLDTIKVSGISPNVALFGNGAKKAFIQNANVQKYLWNRRFELGQIAPVIDDPAVIRFATVPGMECYQYAEYFEDDTGALFPMLPDGVVLLLSTNAQNKIVYGAFTQLEQVETKTFRTYQTSRIPLVYGDLDGGALYYRLTSCPLPMPQDIMAIRYIEALPGSAGPFGRGGSPDDPAPFFEANQGDENQPQPQLSELAAEARERAEKEHAALVGKKKDVGHDDYDAMTVPELRDVAASRGVDINSRSTKAEIIESLKEHDDINKK